MSIETVYKINSKVREFAFFEFNIMSYSCGTLVIAGSEDFSYFHNIEIHFMGVFTVISNIDWKVDTKKDCLIILEGEESFEINEKYRVEEGNIVFRFLNEYDADSYIVARSIHLVDKIVQYFA